MMKPIPLSIIEFESGMRIEFSEAVTTAPSHPASWLLVTQNSKGPLAIRCAATSIPARRKWVKLLKEKISATKLQHTSAPPPILPRPSLRAGRLLDMLELALL